MAAISAAHTHLGWRTLQQTREISLYSPARKREENRCSNMESPDREWEIQRLAAVRPEKGVARLRGG